MNAVSHVREFELAFLSWSLKEAQLILGWIGSDEEPWAGMGSLVWLFIGSMFHSPVQVPAPQEAYPIVLEGGVPRRCQLGLSACLAQGLWDSRTMER